MRKACLCFPAAALGIGAGCRWRSVLNQLALANLDTDNGLTRHTLSP